MFPVTRTRMQNSYGGNRPSRNSSFDEFLSTIAPLISAQDATTRRTAREQRGFAAGEKEKEREYASNEAFRNREFQERNRVADIAARQAEQPPMNTRFQPFIDPFKERQLDIQEQRNLINQNLGLERIASQRELGGERINLGREQITSKEKLADLKNASTEQIAAAKADLERELLTTRGVQSASAIERRGAIQKALANITNEARLRTIEDTGEQQRTTAAGRTVKPESATQEKTRQQLKMNQVLTQHPEWRDYVSINPDTGLVEVADVQKGGFFSKEFTDETRKEILKALGFTDEEKKTDETTEERPEGVPANFKPRKLKSGRIIWEP